jgi:hypothetical protein
VSREQTASSELHATRGYGRQSRLSWQKFCNKDAHFVQRFAVYVLMSHRRVISLESKHITATSFLSLRRLLQEMGNSQLAHRASIAAVCALAFLAGSDAIRCDFGPQKIPLQFECTNTLSLPNDKTFAHYVHSVTRKRMFRVHFTIFCGLAPRFPLISCRREDDFHGLELPPQIVFLRAFDRANSDHHSTSLSSGMISHHLPSEKVIASTAQSPNGLGHACLRLLSFARSFFRTSFWAKTC